MTKFIQQCVCHSLQMLQLRKVHRSHSGQLYSRYATENVSLLQKFRTFNGQLSAIEGITKRAFCYLIINDILFYRNTDDRRNHSKCKQQQTFLKTYNSRDIEQPIEIQMIRIKLCVRNLKLFDFYVCAGFPVESLCC